MRSTAATRKWADPMVMSATRKSKNDSPACRSGSASSRTRCSTSAGSSPCSSRCSTAKCLVKYDPVDLRVPEVLCRKACPRRTLTSSLGRAGLYCSCLSLTSVVRSVSAIASSFSRSPSYMVPNSRTPKLRKSTGPHPSVVRSTKSAARMGPKT